MGIEAKEWVKTHRRSKDFRSGGITVYVNSQSLFNAGINEGVDLEVKQYGCKGMKVILKFRCKE